MTRLIELDCSENEISGTLPQEYASWTSLTIFKVYSNSIGGTLPERYASWSLIEFFYVHANTFSGTLPSDYSRWGSAIRKFRVEKNMLSGSLPRECGNWTSIVRFSATGNGFVGGIPFEYCSWTALSNFDVASNKLNGTLPTCFNKYKLVDTFDVSNNSLNGSIPQLFVLQLLRLSLNNFSGMLPSFNDGSMILDLQNNSGLKGTLNASPSAISTVCGTQVCPATLLEYCLPTSLQADVFELTRLEILSAIWSYTSSCAATAHQSPPQVVSPTVTIDAIASVDSVEPASTSSPLDVAVSVILSLTVAPQLLLGGGGAIGDAQMIAMIGQSVCAPAKLQQSTTSVSSIIVSPFETLGNAAVVLGNGGIMISAIIAMNALVRRCSGALKTRRPVKQRLGPAAISAALAVGFYVLPGIVNATPSSFAISGDDSGSTIALNIVAAVFGVAVVAACAHLHVVLNRHFSKVFVFTVYTKTNYIACLSPHASRTTALALIRHEVLPTLRSALGKLRGAIRGGMGAFALYPTILALLVSLLTGLPVPSSWCTGLLTVVAGVCACGVALVIAFRPNRSRLAGTLHAVSLLLTGVTALLCAIAVAGSASWGDATLPVIAIVSSVVTALRTIYSVFVFLFERRMRATLTNDDETRSISRPDLAGLNRRITEERSLKHQVLHLDMPLSAAADEAASIAAASDPARWDSVRQRLDDLISMICENKPRQLL